MQARETRLTEFFEGPVKYVSPSFQRGYAWKRSRCDRYLRLLHPAGDGEMFLGAVVVMELREEPDGTRKRLLIDGTHRVMTGLALLLALRARLGGPDTEAGRELQKHYFEVRRADGRRSFKCIVPQRDRAVFEAFAKGESPRPGKSGFSRAVAYFREALADLDDARVAEIAREMGERVTMVTLSLARNEDPYPLFKLLNAPGEEFTRRGLREYTRFSSDPELMALIAGGESRDLEFKERTIRVCKGGRGGGEGPFGILRAVAGFMNSRTGGTLLIGVCDDGTIRGIEDEFALVDSRKSNWDGYQLYLAGRLRSRLETKNPFLHYQIERRKVQQHVVCMVRVQPADAPVYLDKRFYVRSGNQTLELLGPDLIDYVRARWPVPAAGPVR